MTTDIPDRVNGFAVVNRGRGGSVTWENERGSTVSVFRYNEPGAGWRAEANVSTVGSRGTRIIATDSGRGTAVEKAVRFMRFHDPRAMDEYDSGSSDSDFDFTGGGL